MKNTQNAVKIRTTDRLFDHIKDNETVIGAVSGFCVGMLSSCSVIFRTLSPFGISAIAASSKKNSMYTLVGAVLGYILSGYATMKNIAACLLVIAMKWVIDAYVHKNSAIITAPIISLIACLSTGIAVSAGVGFNTYDLIMTMSESVLAASGAFFYVRSYESLKNGLNLRNISTTDLASVIITMGLLLLAVSRFTIQGFSIGRSFCVIIILLSACYGKEAMGSITGLSAGLAMSLMGTDYGYLIGCYGLGGLFAGVFSPFGKVGSGAAFILVSAISAISGGELDVILPTLYEVMAASVIFMLLPKFITQKFAFSISKNDVLTNNTGIKTSVKLKLNLASKALNDVCSSVEAVSKRLNSVSVCDYSKITYNVSESICKKCGLKLFCWEKAYNDTMNAYNDMIGVLRQKGKVTKDDVPEYFAKRCCKISEVVGGVNASFSELKAVSGTDKTVSNIRSVVIDQFEGISKMLDGITEEIEETDFFDDETAQKVKQQLIKFGLQINDVSCQIDKYGRMTVELSVFCEEDNNINRTKLTQAVNDVCGRIFDPPFVCPVGDIYKFSFYEKAEYSVDLGVAQSSFQDAKLCGDAFDFFGDGRGKTHMIISDGMGSGGRAAIDGTMASSLLSNLIKAGFKFDAALKIVNSALLIKSGEESLATLDVCCFDMFTGKAEFLKAGAAPTFIRKGEKVGRVEANSLPIGILKGVEFDKTSITLGIGDIILMVSDGVITDSYDWVYAELEAFKSGTANQIAEKIASQAKRRRTDGHDDDITVLAAIICKGL